MSRTKQLRRWCFTVNELEEVALPSAAHLRETLVAFGSQQYVFQTEKVSRLHYQGRFALEDKQTKAWLLLRWVECGWDKKSLTLSPEANAKGAFSYCTKIASRVDGPWSDKPVPDEYKAKDLECMKVPFKWQQQVIDLIECPPDDRHILWIHEPTGNVGKSKLLKWLKVQKMVTKVPIGKAGQLRSAMCKKGPHRAYVVDLPRMLGSDDTLADIFAALEELKNGWVESAFYGKPAEMLFEPPHVIVMSNQKPNLALCSKDRWVVQTVTDRDSLLS